VAFNLYLTPANLIINYIENVLSYFTVYFCNGSFSFYQLNCLKERVAFQQREVEYLDGDRLHKLFAAVYTNSVSFGQQFLKV
jgi:hypothetical protein